MQQLMGLTSEFSTDQEIKPAEMSANEISNNLVDEDKKYIFDILGRLQNVKDIYLQNNPESFEAQFYPDNIIEIANRNNVYTIDGANVQ